MEGGHNVMGTVCSDVSTCCTNDSCTLQTSYGRGLAIVFAGACAVCITPIQVMCLINMHIQAGDTAGLIAQALSICGDGGTAHWHTKHSGGVVSC